MTVAQLKPAKNAAFFEQLAQLNESMLLNAAMTAAVRKDFDSLNGLVDFLMQRGGEIPVLVGNVEMKVCIPRNATDTSIGVEKEKCSIALAFATAMGTKDPESSGKFVGASPPEALALAKRVGELYNMPHPTEDLKDQIHKVLHMAGGQGVDRNVLQALIAAGADAGAKNPCRMDGVKSATLPAVEALMQYHLVSAADLFEMTPPEAVKTYLDSAMKPKAKGGQTEITQFSNAPGMNTLINGLRFQGNRVGACLKQIDAKMAEAGHPAEASRFRMFLAHAYLKKVASRECENFGEKQMLALFGEPGDAVNNGLRSVLDAFARQENPNTGKNPERDKWRAASAIAGTTNFELIEADFLYQAVRTHCADALNISKELLVSAAKGKGPGMDRALDGNMTDRSGTKDQWSLSLDRFKKTMQILIDAGTDPNALPGGRNALHLLANSKASCVMDMMPAVMALVEKPDGMDGAKQTPLDVLKKTRPVDTEMHGRWDSIVKSHAARHSALNLIDEIERDEKKGVTP